MGQHALYFLSYASIATISGIVATWAMYGRLKSENIPINFAVLKVIFGFAFIMWIGVAFANLAYDITPTNAAVFAFIMGTIFSVFLVSQANLLIRKMNADAKTIKELSTSCALTELWNRRVFQERLSMEFMRSQRQKHPLSLLLLDVESIGQVNSTYGYAAGDQVLLGLAKFLTDQTRSVDHVCRYGSNLITIVLPDTALDDAATFANRLRETIAATPFDVGGSEPARITVSIGVSTFSDKTKTDASLVDAAHDALRGARKIGPNQVCALDGPVNAAL